MPRRPKPFFRKQTQSWYFLTSGKQQPLGKDRKEAIRKFHELMADRKKVATESFTLYELSQNYLDWVEAHRSAKPSSVKTTRLKWPLSTASDRQNQNLVAPNGKDDTVSTAS